LTTALVLTGVLLLGVANVATAAKKKLKGQDLYKEYCKPCHEADSENGEYTPMTLIQDQWDRFFEEDYEASHSDVAFAAFDGKNVTDVITP
jgi:cytochrome c5